jgi:hypothetical protein
MLAVEVWLTSSLERSRTSSPRNSTLYRLFQTRLRRQQDLVANSNSLAGAAKDAFYLIGSLCPGVWCANEPQK